MKSEQYFLDVTHYYTDAHIHLKIIKNTDPTSCVAKQILQTEIKQDQIAVKALLPNYTTCTITFILV